MDADDLPDDSAPLASPPSVAEGGHDGVDETHPHGRTFLVVVDDSEEMNAALAYACLRARVTGGRVALLRVIEPSEFQHFAFIDSIMEHEARERAEQLLQRMAAEVNRRSGQLPMLYVREGKAVDELLSLVDEEPGLSILVLAAGKGKDGPGPLVTACGSGLMARLRVPVTIVPAGLSAEDIERLA
ncbi:universal stress protein [Rhodospirillum rubrum]|uniref:universal stress protein n=1 Tax=Rhodospirillum rubrum TaxID=1085 RepID=UPI001908E165|nr:universal stress protein [Rhodospirillum rubrum]MBK1663055.1 universal stress protein [Rhodospirillum rubrum]MBK1677995.1 universal stress protein [Rhodospirillum rubrum]